MPLKCKTWSTFKSDPSVILLSLQPTPIIGPGPLQRSASTAPGGSSAQTVSRTSRSPSSRDLGAASQNLRCNDDCHEAEDADDEHGVADSEREHGRVGSGRAVGGGGGRRCRHPLGDEQQPVGGAGEGYGEAASERGGGRVRGGLEDDLRRENEGVGREEGARGGRGREEEPESGRGEGEGEGEGY